ncbi:hypothetical protein ABZ372_05780 [Streptomyces sp. NPDC005921]
MNDADAVGAKGDDAADADSEGKSETDSDTDSETGPRRTAG